MQEITIADVRKHIRKCIRYKKRYDWLGFVENRALSPAVERLFSHPTIPGYWDWVNGNSRLQKIEKQEEKQNDSVQ